MHFLRDSCFSRRLKVMGYVLEVEMSFSPNITVVAHRVAKTGKISVIICSHHPGA